MQLCFRCKRRDISSVGEYEEYESDEGDGGVCWKVKLEG